MGQEELNILKRKLLEQFQGSGKSEEDLDELIHDIFSEQASNFCNASSLEEKISTIAEWYEEEAAKKI